MPQRQDINIYAPTHKHRERERRSAAPFAPKAFSAAKFHDADAPAFAVWNLTNCGTIKSSLRLVSSSLGGRYQPRLLSLMITPAQLCIALSYSFSFASRREGSLRSCEKIALIESNHHSFSFSQVRLISKSLKTNVYNIKNDDDDEKEARL